MWKVAHDQYIDLPEKEKKKKRKIEQAKTSIGFCLVKTSKKKWNMDKNTEKVYLKKTNKERRNTLINTLINTEKNRFNNVFKKKTMS